MIGVIAPGRVGVRVVEGVDRAARRDVEVEARPGLDVADGKLHALAVRVPEE
jgi:hypothetical protein